MGLTGWLFFGWAILAVYVVYGMCRLLVEILLMLSRAADRYNRRRAVRKAYERDRAAGQAAWYAHRSGQAWPPPGVPAKRKPWDPSQDFTPQWQVTAPRDDPNWVPRG